MTTTPAGYTYDEQLPASPVTEADLSRLLTDVMWTEDDARALRRAGDILKPRVSDILDVWYDFIGSTPHLVSVFSGPDGEPDAAYLARVRGRSSSGSSTCAPASSTLNGWPTRRRSPCATTRRRRTRPTPWTHRPPMYR